MLEIQVKASEILLEIVQKMIMEIQPDTQFHIIEDIGFVTLFSYLSNVEHAYKIEQYLDVLRITNPKMQYSIQIHIDDRKWPTTIRINKQGRKIITEQQTKFTSL